MGFIKNFKGLINTNTDVTYLSKSVESLNNEKNILETSIKQLNLEKKLAQQETDIIKKRLEENRNEYHDLLGRISSQITLEQLQEEVKQLAGTIELYTSIDEAKQALIDLKKQITELTMEKQDITELKSRTKRTEDLYILLYRSFQKQDKTIYLAPFYRYLDSEFNDWCEFHSLFNWKQTIYTDYKMTKRNDEGRFLIETKSTVKFVKAYSLPEVDYLNGTHYATQSEITLYDLNEACKAVCRHEGLDDKQSKKSFTKTK